MRDDLRNEHHTKMRATMTRAKMRATMRNDHQMTKRNRKNAPLLYFTKNIQNARQFSTIVFVQPTEKKPAHELCQPCQNRRKWPRKCGICKINMSSSTTRSTPPQKSAEMLYQRLSDRADSLSNCL